MGYFLGLNRIYSNPLYYSLFVSLAFSLMACTATRQWPMLQVVQKCGFPSHPRHISRLQKYHTLPNTKMDDFGWNLIHKGYQVSRQAGALYAFKGFSGQYSPFLIHAALLNIIFGSTISVITRWHGTIQIPEHENFSLLNHLIPSTNFTIPTAAMHSVIHIDDFSIEYLDNGQVNQFKSDLSVYDLDGHKIVNKCISVNDPLRFAGITIYQTDWDMKALVLLINRKSEVLSKSPIIVPLVSLKEYSNITENSWGSFIPLKPRNKTTNQARGISIVARDFQSIAVYDGDGVLTGIRRFGCKKNIKVEGLEIVVLDAIGSTGLDLKADPSIPIIHFGFGVLIFTSFFSSKTTSRVWALQEGSVLHIGGKNDRISLKFNIEIDNIILELPEYV